MKISPCPLSTQSRVMRSEDTCTDVRAVCPRASPLIMRANFYFANRKKTFTCKITLRLVFCLYFQAIGVTAGTC